MKVSLKFIRKVCFFSGLGQSERESVERKTCNVNLDLSTSRALISELGVRKLYTTRARSTGERSNFFFPRESEI